MRASTHLTLDQLVAIEWAIDHARQPAARRRAEAIRLLHLGLTPAKIAARFGCSAKTIRRWRLRYLDAGVEGLNDRPRSGRPLRANRRYIDELEMLLEHHPRALGFNDGHGCTAQRLCNVLETDTGIALTAGRLRVLLHRLGYRYQKYSYPFPRFVSLSGRSAALRPFKAFLKSVPAYMKRNTYTWVKAAPAALPRR